MKKFLAAILTVAFVVGIISTFAKVNVAEAMQHNIWKCVKCGKKVQSINNPGQYPCYEKGGYHEWIYIGDNY